MVVVTAILVVAALGTMAVDALLHSRRWSQGDTCPTCHAEVSNLSSHVTERHPIDRWTLALGPDVARDYVLIDVPPDGSVRQDSSAGR